MVGRLERLDSAGDSRALLGRSGTPRNMLIGKTAVKCVGAVGTPYYWEHEIVNLSSGDLVAGLDGRPFTGFTLLCSE